MEIVQRGNKREESLRGRAYKSVKERYPMFWKKKKKWPSNDIRAELFRETECEQNHWKNVSLYSISQNIKGNIYQTLWYFVENW